MEEEGEDNVRPDDWYFVDVTGKRFRLPRTMLFIGREACDVLVKVETVDKRHAVITFDHYLERFKIKDLSTTNKTYVNQCRIPEQEYVTLNHMDTVRLGYDSPEYHIEQGSNGNQLTSNTVKLQSTMITKPDTNSKTDCQGLTERHVETCNNHNENPILHDGPPNYILPATTLNKPVMFFAGFEDEKGATEPAADTEEPVVENRIISTTVSTNFFVPFDTNDENEDEFVSSQARKPKVQKNESTNEYDIYLKQEGSANFNGLSHIHGKVKIEGEEYGTGTNNNDAILVNHTESNLSHIQDENKNVVQQEEQCEIVEEQKPKVMEKPTAATVFTIDFDEDKKVKKDLNLSDHIPSKLREKLEARKKTKSPDADSAKKTTASSKDSAKTLERTPLRSSKRLSNGVKTQESKSSDTKPIQNKPLKTQTSKKIETRKLSTEYDSRTYKVKRTNSSTATETRKSSSTPESDKEKRLSSAKNIPNTSTGKKIQRLSKSPESVTSTKSSKSTGTSSKVGLDKKKKLSVQNRSFDTETSSSRAKAKPSSPSSVTKSKVTVKQSRVIEEYSTSPDTSQLVDGKSYLMEKLFESTEIIQQSITQREAVPLTTQLSLPDDNVSNSGTYTIDDEEECNEEEEARQRIDEVFGVSELNQAVRDMSLQDEVYTGNLSDGSTCTPTDDLKRRSFTFDQPDNSDPTKQYVDFEELKAMAIQHGGDVPVWMSQLVALTNQNLQQSSHTVSPSLDTSFSSRSPIDNGKKRPGTGRRLPPIPTNHSTSTLSQSSPLSDSLDNVPENSAKYSPRVLNSKQSPKHSPVASTTSSKKAFVSSTRPNRAFELRRSNATEGSTRRKSVSSVASASPPVSRKSEPKTDRSSASSSARIPRAKAKSTHLSNLKKELKRTSIGESSKKSSGSKSQSTPASRNNSPKTMSFKRRMEYDPRKAVSEAKEKSKRLVKQSQSVAVETTKSTSNLTRSSSCSNSEELCGLGSMKELSRSCIHKSAFSTPSPKDLRNMSPLQRSASLRIRRSTFDTVPDQDVQQNGLHRSESYNPLLVSSIYQLSLQLKSQLDKTVEKLKDEDKISVTPSPIDDFLEEPEKSQFPAWKTANNELISILKNLRRIKHQMQAVDSVLFPTTNDQTLDQIHRLSLEITEFHPIGQQDDFSDEGSLEEFY